MRNYINKVLKEFRKVYFIVIYKIALILLVIFFVAAEDILKKGDYYLETWQIEEAKELAKKLKGKKAEFLKSKIYFYEGNYKQSLEILERNNFKGAFKTYIKDLYKTTKGFIIFESKHFKLRLSKKDIILKDYTISTLEKAYIEVGNDLDFYPKKKVLVEIYPDDASFQFASTLSRKQIENSGAIGICKFNKIMIISPRMLLFGYQWRDALTHEYTHYLIGKITHLNIPLWFNEGIAKYEETRWRSSESLYLSSLYKNYILNARKDNEWIDFQDMSKGMPNLNNIKEVILAFAEVSNAVDFFIRKFGKESLKRVLKEFSQTSPDRAFKKITGKSIKDFTKMWKRYISSLNIIGAPEVRPNRYTLKKKAQDYISEFVEKKARDNVRLGDRFLKMGKLEVSLIEYRKALKNDVDNPYILNQIGKIYVLRQNLEKAKQIFLKVIEKNPDFSPSHMHLGDIYFKENNFDKAIKHYKQCININPFIPSIHKNLAQIYFYLEDTLNASKEIHIYKTLLPLRERK